MSLALYFLKQRTTLCMPTPPDSLGIRFDGPVLTGQKSVQQAQRDAEIDALTNPSLLDDTLLDKPRSLTPPGELEPAQRGILRLPGKFPQTPRKVSRSAREERFRDERNFFGPKPGKTLKTKRTPRFENPV